MYSQCRIAVRSMRRRFAEHQWLSQRADCFRHEERTAEVLWRDVDEENFVAILALALALPLPLSRDVLFGRYAVRALF